MRFIANGNLVDHFNPKVKPFGQPWTLRS